MKIFGTIFPFIESNEQSYKIGRHVANFEFFISLITNANFDEFHIFCLSVNHFKTTREKLLQESIPETQKQKVRLFLYTHLTKQISTTEYHVFHLGGWGYFFPGLVYLRNKYAKNKFPITGLIHSLNGIETNYHAMKMCFAPLLSYDTIICSSEAGQKVVKNIFTSLSKALLEQNVKSSFSGNTAIIPLGVNDTFLQKMDKQICRERLSIPEYATVLLTLGRLSPQTKADLFPLIKTFKRLSSDIADKPLVLIIAGGASKAQQKVANELITENGLEDSVYLVTNFETELKQYLYGSADIYISLSDNLQETFGISVIEAMGAGMPVVVSDLNGYKDLVTHGKTGYKVPTLWTDRFDMAELADIMNFRTMQIMLAQCMVVDVEKLYEYLNTLINNQDLQISIGKEGRKTVQKKFRWSTIIGQYESLWDTLFEQSQSYEGNIEQRTNPFLNDYLNNFSHYSTSTVNEDYLCVITNEGRETINSGKTPIPYTDIGTLLNSKVVLEILKLLIKKKLCIHDILKKIAGPKETEEPLYTLLWMAKYGLITIVPKADNR
jgi:glycosyltransferase involved in cell wall biosynthesis